MLAHAAIDNLENDLPSLANQAAIELDTMVLGGPVRLEAVRQLASQISRTVTDVNDPGSPSSLLNVRTAVLVNRAIGEAAVGPANSTLDELLKRTKEVTGALLALDQVHHVSAAELARLRNFCVALSRHALAREVTPDDRPQHPFRRALP